MEEVRIPELIESHDQLFRKVIWRIEKQYDLKECSGIT